VVLNGTGFAVQVEIDSQPLTGPIVEDGSAAVLYCDGTNVQTVAAATGGVATLNYDFGFSFPGGPPVADEVVSKVVIARDITIPADMAGGPRGREPGRAARHRRDRGRRHLDRHHRHQHRQDLCLHDRRQCSPAGRGGQRVRFVAPATPVGDAQNIAVTLQAAVD
jgi:hypothetical protein